MTTSLSKFDPGDHPNNLYDAFENFIESFAYEYEAITKQPPAGTTDPEEWHEINKRKQFLGKFASRDFQKDYEDSTTPEERKTMKFSQMVAKIKDRYKPTKNTTLSN